MSEVRERVDSIEKKLEVLKGGPGSGVKGHTTARQKSKSVKAHRAFPTMSDMMSELKQAGIGEKEISERMSKGKDLTRDMAVGLLYAKHKGHRAVDFGKKGVINV